MEDEELFEFFTYLEDQGVLEWVGMNEIGERTFVFNFDRMHDIMPQLYYAMIDELNQELLHLYELGLVEIEYNENLEAHFKITDAGKQYLLENGIPIPEEFDDES